MSQTSKSEPTTEQEHRIGVSRDERQQMLLDDLRVEIARLADAVEAQNEHLERLDIAAREGTDD